MANATTTLLPTGTWIVDRTHSKVGFAVKHVGIATVRGEFTEFAGSMEVGEDVSTIRVHGTVGVASVDTSQADRDAHLRSADFFDAERYPEMTFESSTVEPLDAEAFRIKGELTMHGVTREVVLRAEVLGTATDPWNKERAALEVTGELSRGEFDMKFNQALSGGNLLVGDKIKITLDISAVRE